MPRFLKSGKYMEKRFVLDSVWSKKSSAVSMAERLRKDGDNVRVLRNSRHDWEVWVHG